MMVEEETMGGVEIGNRLFSIPVSEKPHFFSDRDVAGFMGVVADAADSLAN